MMTTIRLPYVGKLVLCITAGFFAVASAQAQITPDSAAAQCKQYFDSVDNLQMLSRDRDAMIAIKRCIDLGVDPPLKTRNDRGGSAANSVAEELIPGKACPPFEPCLYGARVTHEARTKPRAARTGMGPAPGAQICYNRLAGAARQEVPCPATPTPGIDCFTAVQGIEVPCSER